MYNNVEKPKNSQLRKEDWQAFIEPDYAISKQGDFFRHIFVWQENSTQLSEPYQ